MRSDSKTLFTWPKLSQASLIHKVYFCLNSLSGWFVTVMVIGGHEVETIAIMVSLNYRVV